MTTQPDTMPPRMDAEAVQAIRDRALVEAAGTLEVQALDAEAEAKRFRGGSDPWADRKARSRALRNSAAAILALRDKPVPAVTVQEAKGLAGPINVGDKFVWMPHVPHAMVYVTVTKVVPENERQEAKIFTRNSDGSENWNDESRFREACVRAIAGGGDE